MDRPEGICTAALYQYESICASKNAVCLTVIEAENVFNVDLPLQSSLHRALVCLHQRGAAEQPESSGTHPDLSPPMFPRAWGGDHIPKEAYGLESNTMAQKAGEGSFFQPQSRIGPFHTSWVNIYVNPFPAAQRRNYIIYTFQRTFPSSNNHF